MKFVEAVNRVEEKYGKQAFDRLEDYADDEAVQILLEERKRSSSKANVRRLDVKVLCVNRSTGEQVEFKTLAATEHAFGLPHCALSERTKNGRTFVHGDWEIRRKS